METVRGNGLSKRQNRVGSKKKHKGGEGDKQKGGKNKGKCQNAETVVKTDTVWWNTIGSGHTLECKMRIRHSRMWIQFQSIHVKFITQTLRRREGSPVEGSVLRFSARWAWGWAILTLGSTTSKCHLRGLQYFGDWLGLGAGCLCHSG